MANREDELADEIKSLKATLTAIADKHDELVAKIETMLEGPSEGIIGEPTSFRAGYLAAVDEIKPLVEPVARPDPA